MAKLNGVKTIDMVNGEITKISYKGAEYARIANNFKDAQTGDLFLSSGSMGSTHGEFYEITIRDSDFYGVNHPVRFVADSGTDSGYMRGCNIHPIFRKISDIKPTIEQRVTALESDVQALKGEQAETVEKAESKPKLKAGDFVKFSNSDCYSDITLGKAYEVYEDGDGELAFLDDVGDERNYPLTDDDCEYEILSAEEAKWAKIGRKVGEFKVGDVVEITRYQYGAKVGEVVVLSQADDLRVHYPHHEGSIGFSADVDAIKLIAPVDARFDK